jgi:deoxyribonuclease-4
MSIEGGFERAAERASQVEATALQVFVKSSNQWKARPFAPGEAEGFPEACRRAGVDRVVAHDSYLINLCSGDPALWERSLQALAEEVRRCDALGIPGLVTHPGAHGGDGDEAGLARLVRALDRLEEMLPAARAKVLLETTAGQGTGVGHRFEHLRHVLDRVRNAARLGVCLDTCHVFAAGYDLRTKETYERTLAEFDQQVGIARLGAIHLNDSKKDLGSRVDRHEHIGQGCLGLEAFRLVVNDPRLRDVPMVLETPKNEDLREDVENLNRLRALIGARTAEAAARLPAPSGAAAGGAAGTKKREGRPAGGARRARPGSARS